jgi:hypothetical protein
MVWAHGVDGDHVSVPLRDVAVPHADRVTRGLR